MRQFSQRDARPAAVFHSTPAQPDSDAETVRMALGGTPEAFSELVIKHRSRVYRTAFRILRNAEDAEDATQDSFLNAFRHLGEFRHDASFSTWITRVAINTALMSLRKSKRHPDTSLDDGFDGEGAVADSVASEDPSPEQQVLRNESVARLYAAIHALPPALRGITLDRLKDDASVVELASRRGVSTAAAKSRLLRARRTIATNIRVQTESSGGTFSKPAPDGSHMERVRPSIWEQSPSSW